MLARRKRYVSFNFKGLSQQIPNKRLWRPEVQTQKCMLCQAHFSAIFNLLFLKEVFVSFMILTSFILLIIEIFLNTVMETKLVNLVPLNGTNYATWKVQCKMALIRDGVWNIVNGTEIVPDSRTEMDYMQSIYRAKIAHWQ